VKICATAALSPPAHQNAVGIGGELQLAFPHFAIAGGYTYLDRVLTRSSKSTI
jgi:hypothetical protein